MKPRNREINIFNMSLLDVLCGALGTFCFMMLVLFPFYSQDKGTAKAPDVPPGIDPKTYRTGDGAHQGTGGHAQTVSGLRRAARSENEADAARKAARPRPKPTTCERRTGSSNPAIRLLWWRASSLRTAMTSSSYEEDNCPEARQTKGLRSWTRRVCRARSGPAINPFMGPVRHFFVTRDAPPCEFRFFLKFLKHNTDQSPHAVDSSLCRPPTIWKFRRTFITPAKRWRSRLRWSAWRRT